MSDERFKYGHLEGLWFETESGFELWKEGIREETIAKLIIARLPKDVKGMKVVVLWQPDPIECALKMERVRQEVESKPS